MDEQQASEAEGPVIGFLASVTRVLATLVDMIYTRLELLFLDLQEGSERLLGLVLWGLAGVLAAAMTLFLGALSLIFIFWDTHRVLVALLLTGFFAAVAIASALVVAAKARTRYALLAATLEEFSKDREHFDFKVPS